jgi:outer membrane protein assembly factor BamA
VNLFRRDQGFIREGSVEIGGNLPYVLDRFIFTPDVLEGSLPGLPFFTRADDEQSRLVYRQYVRLLADMRRYKPFGERSVFAWKAIAGLAHQIGKAPVVPFDRRFYAGGASSIRGWGLRELGPGRIAARDSVIQGGDIKLELSVETRNTVLRSFMEADWIAVMFADAGNVWYGPRNPGSKTGKFRAGSLVKDIGLGAGVGLRVAWEYLIIRFDLGFQIRNPNEGFFGDGFGNPRLHFGIGHAF